MEKSKREIPKVPKEVTKEEPKMGRPTKYNEEIANQICELIATTGTGLNAICLAGNFPAPSTVYLWLNEHKDFSEKYARARELQADMMFEKILKVAEDKSGDWNHTKEGSYPNGVNVQRDRLRIDALKWAASKLAPKKYGDKIDHTTGGEPFVAAPAPNIIIHSDGPPLSSSETDVDISKK